MIFRVLALIARIISGEPLAKATANHWRWFGRAGFMMAVVMFSLARAEHFMDKATPIQLFTAVVAFFSIITLVPMMVAPKIPARIMAAVGFVGFALAFAQVALFHLKH